MIRAWGALVALWLLVLVVSLWGRPPWPVDETRYLSVAWEMWLRGDWLVPHLNGAPYSHKPPLYFWLMHLGWGLFGVNEWWPRLIAPLAALLNLVLVAYLARLLWPGDRLASLLAPWLLFGSLFWLLFYPLVQFDLLLTLWVLLGVIGLVRAQRGLGRGWMTYALALGLGGLTKGPVILVHLLPLALVAPLWAEPAAPSARSRWYGHLVLALLSGLLLALAWALPAAITGGESYRQAILWGQHMGRLQASADHAAPWWAYLPLLPAMLLPWILWPRLWRALRGMSLDPGLHLCLLWVAIGFLLFSLISGKQAKYLLPLLPALALVAARALSRSPVQAVESERFSVLWLLGAGALLLLLPELPLAAPWLPAVDSRWGWALVFAGVLWWVLPVPSRPAEVARVSGAAALIVVAAQLGLIEAILPNHDLRALSRHLAALQSEGAQVALNRPYHGQFHFLGRLERPLGPVLGEFALREWAADRPCAYVLVHADQWAGPYEGARFAQRYRTGALVLWRAADYLRRPVTGAGLFPQSIPVSLPACG